MIRSFPKPVRIGFGEAILAMQRGARLGMPLSRPMTQVGRSVHELRIRDATGIYRAFYVVRAMQGVLVFHAFQKKTQKTPVREVEVGRKRLAEM